MGADLDKMNFDSYMEPRVTAFPDTGVAWYLMASYAYYWEDDPILSDSAFDQLGKDLLARWDKVQHRHKHLLSEDELRAGSCLLSKDKYPGMTIGALHHLRLCHGCVKPVSQ